MTPAPILNRKLLHIFSSRISSNLASNYSKFHELTIVLIVVSCWEAVSAPYWYCLYWFKDNVKKRRSKGPRMSSIENFKSYFSSWNQNNFNIKLIIRFWKIISQYKPKMLTRSFISEAWGRLSRSQTRSCLYRNIEITSGHVPGRSHSLLVS